MNNKYYNLYLQYLRFFSSLALLLIINLIITQLIFGSITYCEGSADSFTFLVENPTINRDNGDINANCSTVFTSYHEMVRRKLYWYFCIKRKGTFVNYSDYKQAWDPDIKVFNEINKEFKNGINSQIHRIHVQKRTFEWIFNPRSRGSRRS
jgi:hypothetical protein